MYLKALEMRGFKSFPDKTRLDFQTGVTAVVGPNGSGKSNVSDAVRWVLGEMSPKSLRGSKMEDVIFAGTAKRTQTGFCEVSLIVDNSDHALDNDAEEVKITRKYYRSGDSEYKINDKPSRLRDIHELFLNTGIGREGYSVVGQGKISEVLSQKSDERRHIFEEAAGISKFRYRKIETERKLNETDTNLIRLNDIAGEIESRLGPLERDAENAKKFLVLADRKKELEVAIWLDRIVTSSDKAKNLENKHGTAKKNYEDTDNEITLLDSAIEGLFNKKQFISQKAENQREEISLLEEEKHRLENLRSLSNNDITHHNERKTQISAEIALLSGDEMEKIKGELLTAEEAVKTAEGSVVDANKKSADAEVNLIAMKDAVIRAEAALESKKEEVRHSNEVLTTLKIEEAAESTSEKSETERKEFLAGEISKADAELEETYKALENANQRKKDFQDEKVQLAKDIEEEQGSLRELANKREDLLKEKNEIEAQYAADVHRREVLDRMDKMLEGYPGSVKAVMNESTLSGICGPVSRILTVSGEYVTAIETALGASVSNIVVENEHSAKEAIRFLKRTNGGRATFLPLSSMTTKVTDEKGLTREKGYVGIACDLVSFEEKYRVIAENLLGRTIVADNIDDAADIAKKYSYRFRIVTLDGQIINSGGSFTGGSAASRTGVMSRSADIAALEESISALGARMKEIKAEISEVEEECQNSIEYIEGLKNDLSNADSGLYRSENDIKLHTEHVEACSERLKNMHAQLEEFDSEKIKERLSLIVSKRQAEEAHLELLINEEKELTDALDKADEDERNATEALSQSKMDILSCEKDVQSANTALSALRASLADNVRRTENLRLELQQIENMLAGISVDIEKSDEEIKKAEETLKEKKEALEALISDSQVIETEMNKKRENQKDMQKDKEVFFEEMTRLASQLENCRNEYDNLTAKLFEEYTLTFSDAVALGYPAPEAGSAQELSSIKGKIKALGHINVNAVEEFKETKERYDFMKKQIDDLEDSKKSLIEIIKRLESDMKTMFVKTVEDINVQFKEVFSDLFGGGNADIVIQDPENVLESGIEINIQPPGKMVKNLSLLSGGEQAFTAIALYFAILKVNPAPFYIFDEIEAALDDVNVNRFASYLKKNNDTQFIVITHRRGTMEVADTMYGVTMQEKGVSSFLKVNIDDVEKKTGIKL
ncbi:MAG: chromosome segregation protein SMC [Ruminococcaceae bacterium]|nr:chromosome segregation protein SMC [Oscillospiraceae bacterium]